MMKPFVLAFALAGSIMLPVSAGGMPIDAGLDSVVQGKLTLVRESCGPGRQYSEALRRCVVSTAGSVRRDIRKDVVRCGVGLKWSDRLRRCVAN